MTGSGKHEFRRPPRLIENTDAALAQAMLILAEMMQRHFGSGAKGALSILTTDDKRNLASTIDTMMTFVQQWVREDRAAKGLCVIEECDSPPWSQVAATMSICKGHAEEIGRGELSFE